MKTNIFKITLLAVAISTLMSCSDDDNYDNDDKHTYKLESVMWKLEDTDKQEFSEEEYPEVTFENNGNTISPLTYDVYEFAKETSYFETDDTEKINKWTDKETFIPIPSYFEILNTKYGYISDSRTAPLYAGTQLKVKSPDSLTLNPDLQPKTKVRIQTTIVYKKMTATYRARFVSDEDADKYYEVTGKWTGKLISQPKNKVIYENID